MRVLFNQNKIMATNPKRASGRASTNENDDIVIAI
jgi:hypothetical protein